MTSSPIFSTVWEIPERWRSVVRGTFDLTPRAIDNPSPWTGQRTPYGPYVQFWTVEITPPPAPGDRHVADGSGPSWRDWQGFRTRLRGTQGLVRLVDYFRMRPRYDDRHDPTYSRFADGSRWADGSEWKSGPLPPFVTVAEAARAEADSIVLAGLPADTEAVLDASDLMEGRPNGQPTPWGNLYEIVHCARTNATGRARVYFQPGLRQGFSVGDPFHLRYPTLVARYIDAGQGKVARSQGNIGRLGMTLIEELRND